jgi:hypothetical protein
MGSFPYLPLGRDEFRLLSIEPCVDANIVCCHLENYSRDQMLSGVGDNRLWPGYDNFRYDYKALFTKKVQRCDCDHCTEIFGSNKECPHSPSSKETGTADDLSGRYLALSYTWGPVTQTRTIIVNGVAVEITTKLHAALVQLRSTEWVRRGIKVWADALCINQGDLDERESQVSITREIYLSAWQVAVWLGPATDQLATAFTALSWLARNVHAEEKLNAFMKSHNQRIVTVIPWFVTAYDIFPWRPDVYSSLRSFFAHEYWHRLWILQELAMARTDAPVLCGDHCLSFQDVWMGRRSGCGNTSSESQPCAPEVKHWIPAS